MTDHDLSQRSIRQDDIIGQDSLKSLSIIVAGVGAIGRQVAIQLACMGVGRLSLYDPDVVAVENLATQGWPVSQLDMPKVNAVTQTIRMLNGDVHVDSYPDKLTNQATMEMLSPNIMFCCVDDIDARRQIWEAHRDHLSLFVDARMSAMVARIITDRPQTIDASHYESTLFHASEAIQEGCTAKATIYCANIAAGLMVNAMVGHIRGFMLPLDITLNLMSAELEAAPEPVEA